MSGVELMQQLVLDFLLLLTAMFFAGAFGFLLLIFQLHVQKKTSMEQFTAFMFANNALLFFVILLFWRSKW
jgi:uncharacterized membrane protein SpoIIM required for sporulation